MVVEDKKSKDTKSKNPNDYSMRGLAEFGLCLLAAFLVWCTFNYPMSSAGEFFFFVWAICIWLEV